MQNAQATDADAAFVGQLRAMAGTSAAISTGTPDAIISRSRRRTAQRRTIATSALSVLLFTGAGLAAVLPNTGSPTPVTVVSESVPAGEIGIAPLSTDLPLVRVSPMIEGGDDDATFDAESQTGIEVAPGPVSEVVVPEVAPVAVPSPRDTTPIVVGLGGLGAVTMGVAGWFASRAKKVT